MKNCKFSIVINSNDIYAKILPEQKENFDSVKIIGASLSGDSVIIECLALKEKTVQLDILQKFDNNITLEC